MKKIILIPILIIISRSTFADCDYRVTVPSLTYTVGDINPSVPGTITILRDKNNGVKCDNFFFAFTKGWAGSYSRSAQNLINGDVLYYNLYKNSNSTGVLKEVNDITSSNEVIFDTIARYETKNLNYYFNLASISSSLPPRSGTYIDIIQVQTYSGTYNAIEKYEGYKNLNIFINVPKFISLSLVDSGATHDETKTSKSLDFGELEELESQDFDVRIVSNSGYKLNITSSNNGLLKKLGGVGVNSQIAYDFYANNTLKSLTSSSTNPVIIASNPGRTPAGGAQIPIKIVIKSVLNKDPGTYQDYLTLSVISND